MTVSKRLKRWTFGIKGFLLAAFFLLVPALARAQSAQDAQALVDRSTIALQEMMTQTVSPTPRNMLDRSRAVLICPRVFKAGFFFGGSGGNCVLLARAGNGTWSYPAFYIMGGISFGLQIGLQDSEVVMMIMTDRGLNAVLNSSFKLGVGASVAVAVIGGGVQGDTTAAVGADIVAFMISRGAFAGISLEGSILSQQTGWNQAYYGQPFDARQIVIDMQGRNPGADPLREMLTRNGVPQAPTVAAYPSPGQPPSYAPPPAYQPPPAYAPPAGYPQAPVNLQPNAPIRSESLPPPR